MSLSRYVTFYLFPGHTQATGAEGTQLLYLYFFDQLGLFERLGLGALARLSDQLKREENERESRLLAALLTPLPYYTYSRSSYQNLFKTDVFSPSYIPTGRHPDESDKDWVS